MSAPSAQNVRIAIVGNVANSGYRCTVALRSAGYDAHLIVNNTDPFESRPENDDPSLASRYPTWIHGGDWVTPWTILNPSQSALVRLLREFDAIVASGPGPIYAQFARRPWCFLSTGGDLTVKPFPFRFWRNYSTNRMRAAQVVAGYWQRRAIRRCPRVFLQPFAPPVEAADRLGLSDRQQDFRLVPIAVDLEAFDPSAEPSPELRRWVDKVVPANRFVIFHPSRMLISRREDFVRSGQWKGNDVLIEAVADLVAEGHRDLALVLPDAEFSNDLGVAKDLISRLNIENSVHWVTPPNGRSLSRAEMAALYSRADVVADEFGVGWFGYVSLEGLAMGKPTLCHVDEVVMERLYGDHPLVSANDPATVAGQIREIMADSRGQAALAWSRREWVRRHHGPAAASSAVVGAVLSILEDEMNRPTARDQKVDLEKLRQQRFIMGRANHEVKRLIMRAGARIPHLLSMADKMANFLAYGSFLRRHSLNILQVVPSREMLFDLAAGEVRDLRVAYLEFGVFEGASMRHWVRALPSPDTRFVGFDTFEGLPEDWNDRNPAGTFSVGGRVPEISDSRVTFIRGRFEETLPAFKVPDHEALILNLDADLYSSTVTVLESLRSEIVTGTLIYFDEFNDRHHEMNALDEFLTDTGMTCEVVGVTNNLWGLLIRVTGQQ